MDVIIDAGILRILEKNRTREQLGIHYNLFSTKRTIETFN